MPRAPVPLTRPEARRLWLHAQRLDTPAPFGGGAQATRAAVEHLGYVQIDTINVIERCHHHILFTRIPGYSRAHLHQAQSVDKSLFEYWTHALSYVPTRDLRFFLPEMRRQRQTPRSWFASVAPQEVRRVVAMVRRDGALSIRDFDDEVRIEKDHPWASTKPSKRALQLAFHTGALTVAERSGMLKIYELPERHFGWEKAPKPAGAKETLDYLLDRALRAQGLVSLDSICHLDAGRKAAVRALIEARVRRGALAHVAVEGFEKAAHWIAPAALETPAPGGEPVHILSPFDPLIIQRRRLSLFFGYEHRFEAYVPKAKRVLGYFALPVLIGDRIVAAIDVKTDREKRTLMIRQWTWIGRRAAGHKARNEAELGRFERFQLGA